MVSNQTFLYIVILFLLNYVHKVGGMSALLMCVQMRVLIARCVVPVSFMGSQFGCAVRCHLKIHQVGVAVFTFMLPENILFGCSSLSLCEGNIQHIYAVFLSQSYTCR